MKDDQKKAEAPKPVSQKPAAPIDRPHMAMPRNRHDMHFRHDCFWASVEKCIQNNSFEFMKLTREDVEHRHVYHSHSNQGKKLTRTGSNCGHWHSIEHYVDPSTGATMAKCGPAMRETTKLSPTGRTYSVLEPVYFETEIVTGPDAGSIAKVVDNHTHQMEYRGSEELSPQGISDSLKDQRALAATMGINIDPQAIKDNTPAPMSPADGANIS